MKLLKLHTYDELLEVFKKLTQKEKNNYEDFNDYLFQNYEQEYDKDYNFIGYTKKEQS